MVAPPNETPSEMRDGVHGLNLLARLDGEAEPLASGDGATLPKKQPPAPKEPPPQAAAAAAAAADADSDSEPAKLTEREKAEQILREQYTHYNDLPQPIQEMFTRIILKGNKAEEELAALKAQKPTEAQKSTEAQTATEAQKPTEQPVRRTGGRQKRKAAYLLGANKGGTALATAAAGEKRKRNQPVAEEGEETEEEDGEPARRVRRKDSECPVMQK